MLIDTHAHVNFKSYESDAGATIQRALDSGIWVVNVGSQIDTSRQCVELARRFASGVYAVVGLHPEHTHAQYVDEEETHFQSREEAFDYEQYKVLAQDEKVVGIGECGLDYYRLPGAENEELRSRMHAEIKEKQQAAFRLQIKLARELNKALVIHSRPALHDEGLYEDLLAILDEELVSGMRFEVHSFTGSPAALRKFLDRGAYVSFNGIVTFDKTGNMENLVALVPMDKLILETDCPYLTPVPHRGKRNEPAYVSYVAQKIAELKGLPVDRVSEYTTRNARELFRLA